MYDRVMAGWDVTVLLADGADERPLQSSASRRADLESALALWADRPHPQTVAVAADLFASDERVRRGVLGALEQGLTEVRCGAKLPAGTRRQRRTRSASPQRRRPRVQVPGPDGRTDATAGSVADTETFRCGVMATPSVAADLVPAS